MKYRYDFDGALKDVFEHHSPTFLQRLTGGVRVKAVLNTELRRVSEHRVDLVLLLADGTILHIEFQSWSDPEMHFRMLGYWVPLRRRYGRRIHQVVVFVGQGKMRMPHRIREDRTTFEYDLVDIRDFDADTLLGGNAGDLALAILAGGGEESIGKILASAGRLSKARREKLLALVLVLAGLRKLTEKVEWEMKHMGLIIDIRDNPFLMRTYREGVAEGEVRGRAEGKAEGKAETLRGLLEAKFGRVPRSVDKRLAGATVSQIDRWAKRVLIADSLDAVFGRK